jgi:hypothetical protein
MVIFPVLEILTSRKLHPSCFKPRSRTERPRSSHSSHTAHSSQTQGYWRGVAEIRMTCCSSFHVFDSSRNEANLRLHPISRALSSSVNHELKIRIPTHDSSTLSRSVNHELKIRIINRDSATTSKVRTWITDDGASFALSRSWHHRTSTPCSVKWSAAHAHVSSCALEHRRAQAADAASFLPATYAHRNTPAFAGRQSRPILRPNRSATWRLHALAVISPRRRRL